MNIRDYKTAKKRREALEKELRVSLSHTGAFTLDEAAAATRNCENMIGAVQIPLGVAGPLKMKSMNDERLTMNDYYIPLATTEGALVASVNRGSKAITDSGGALVDSRRVGATRAPVFDVKNLAGKRQLEEFVCSHRSVFEQLTKETSGHCTLTGVTVHGAVPYVYIRFVFDTQDAMGMNMATIAATSVCHHIETHTGFRCISVSGNVCADKKPSWINSVLGRGFSVSAEVTVPKKVLAATLKTTASDFYDVWVSKCMVGSAVAGSMGYNAHMANIVAALFIATGQDPAHVVEASSGMTIARKEKNGDLYLSVTVPSLMVGTVGGGTRLATQKEALSIAGLAGGSSETLAQVVGGAVLAGELSLISSLAEGSLAKAHKTLARGQGNSKHKTLNSK